LERGFCTIDSFCLVFSRLLNKQTKQPFNPTRMPPQSDQVTRQNAISGALLAIENAPPNDRKVRSIRHTAKRFGIPEANLRRAIRNGGPPGRPGPTKVLTDHEEQQLAGYCTNMQKLGFGLSRAGVSQCALDVMRQNKRPHPFGENGPSEAWWRRFMRDHPELSFRVPQALSEARAQRANPVIIKDYFDKLRKVLQEHSLTPDRIWNMDETGFVLEPGLQKVVAKKGSRQVHHIACGNSHDHISVWPTICAAGMSIPPLFIYKGKRVIPGLLDGAPAGSVMGYTETGYMRESLFRMYLEHFVNSISPARPALLILDGHKSHINYVSVDFCHKNNIILFALPPHTTHILQSAELPFAQLKKAYNKCCNKFRIDNNGEIVTKYTFAKILGSAYMTAYTPIAISNAFKATGIWPFNPDAIDTGRLDPSLVTERFNIPAPPQQLVQPASTNIDQSNNMTGSQCVSQPNPIPKPFTRSSAAEELVMLREDVETLDKRVKQLEFENTSSKHKLEELQEELQTFKNPGTTSLRVVLKYPLPHTPRPQAIEEADTDREGQSEIQPQKKRRKTLPFAQILTNEASLKALKEAEEEVVRKAEETRKKKEEAAKKRVLRDLERAKKREETLRRDKERAQKKRLNM
jgi:hypothetical protein